MLNLEEVFEKHNEEFLHFERIEKPRHPRPDLCAFLMLHDLAPKHGDMVSSASHDEIWLEVEVVELADVITEEQVIDLIRCGIRYSDDCLCMFV